MSTGKQLSFERGEVSPSLRFRSDAVSYGQGLSKLKNMYVRKAGGVSNRAGFEFISLAISQEERPVPGGEAGIKGYTYWSTAQQKWVHIEYFKHSDGFYRFTMDGVQLLIDDAATPVSPTPGRVQFTPTKDGIFVTPAIKRELFALPGFFNESNLVVRDKDNHPVYPAPTDPYVDSHPGEKGGTGPSCTISPLGSTASGGPFMPVTYLFTLEYKDGREEMYLSLCTAGYIPGSNNGTGPYYPHAALSNRITLVLGAAVKDLKRVNLYRASGVVTENATTTPGPLYYLNGFKHGSKMYRLVQRFTYDGSLTMPFDDFGAEDPAITPPIDASLLGTFGNGMRAVAAANYQQRLVTAPKAGYNGFKAGDMVASKLGAPDQQRAPLIYSDTGAFQLSIPVTDGTPALFFLEMERLIAFTERGTYVIRGGEQGVLTPTSVNPLQISTEGCSALVAPKAVQKRGYFLNASHTKLMVISFGFDAAVEVTEATEFSDHFLEVDISEMVVLGGQQDTVFLLRRDGTLAQITVSAEGVCGFAMVQTDGYVESIFRGKASLPYFRNQASPEQMNRLNDVLMAYIVRGKEYIGGDVLGLRTLERLTPRMDKYREGEFYADSYSSFGWRLAEVGVNGYRRQPARTEGMDLYYDFDESTQINIEPAASYLAGHPVKIHSTASLSGQGLPYVIHFQYGSLDNPSVLRYLIDVDSEVPVMDGPFVFEYTGSFTSDVPLALQNANGQDISAQERIKLLTRWLPAIKDLPVADFMSGAYITAKDEGDGTYGGYKAPASVTGDGEILSSPLNPNRDTLYMQYNEDYEAAMLILPDYFSYGCIGVPYESEFETMDLETGGAETLTSSRKIISEVGVGIMETRGGFIGNPEETLEEMSEMVIRKDEAGDMFARTENFNGYYEQNIKSKWTRAGRVNIKNVDPVPMTILSIYPKGLAGN